MNILMLTVSKKEADENWDCGLCGVGDSPKPRYAKYLCGGETNKTIISVYLEGNDRYFTIKMLVDMSKKYPSIRVMYLHDVP